MNFGNLFARYVHPEIAGMARYASELAGPDPLPRRGLFNPSHISAILDFVYLIEVEGAENDYRFSLFGQRMAALFGVDLDQMRLSQIGAPLVRESLRRSYDRVVQTHLPLYMRGYYVWPEKSIPIERLLVPMAGDDGQLTTICGISVPEVADTDLELFAGRGAAQLVGDDELLLQAA